MKIIRPNTINTEGSFTRDSTATYYDSAGVLQTAAINEPRFNYNPETLQFEGILLESERTNLARWSEDFGNASWAKTRSTITANATVAPDGTLTADKLVEDTSVNNSHRTSQSGEVTSGTAYTLSVYAKPAGRNAIFLDFLTTGSITNYAYFDLVSGTVALQQNVTATITPAGNGWYRCSISATALDSITSTNRIYSAVTAGAGGNSYTGDGVSGIFIWGAQMEVGTKASSYIPTTATAVTRSADTITGDGLVYTNVPENDYPEWNSSTSYSLGDRIIRLTTHKIYENLIAGVNAGLPENTPTRWLEVSPTNRWAIFDEKVGTQTTQSTGFIYVLKPGRTNSVALLGMDAASADVCLSITDELIYAGSADLLSGNVVGDWHEYFYEPIYQKDSLVVTEVIDTALLNLPIYGEGVITVRVNYPASTAKLGVLVTGLSSDIGLTQYDVSLGIIDYSVKETDDFGNTTVVQRTFSKRMNTDVVIPNQKVDNVARILTIYRTTPLVWVATENVFNSLVVYGFYKDWEIVVRGPTVSTMRLEVEGLT